MSDISVLVTSHLRPHTLEPQLEAIASQTVAPTQIVVWQNGLHAATKQLASANYIACKANWGVWPRFSFPLYAFKTKYVAIFDDDTIPGCAWFENCLYQMSQTPGLLGTNGVQFPSGERSPRQYVGWSSRNERPERVDIIGHCWFFEREWLRYFCEHPVAPSAGETCGEDYHFSVAMQKHHIPTIVPPHPAGNRDLWGSVQGELGIDDKALYMRPGEEEKKAAVHAEYRAMGWKPRADQSRVTA